MKKITAALLVALILMSSLLIMTVSAASAPELMLSARYDDEEKTITVLYRVNNFVGTECAALQLKFDNEALTLINEQPVKMKSVYVESGISADAPNIYAIQFIDLYCVTEKDCEEDGSATVMSLKFKVNDESLEKTSLAAICKEYFIDPDSTEISLDRATLSVPLKSGSIDVTTDGRYAFPDKVKFEKKDGVITAGDNAESQKTNENLKKVFIAAGASAVFFVVVLVVTVVKFRKKDDKEDKKKK